MVSKLASRNSASARGAASEHTVQSDPIFDKYLEKEDDGTCSRQLIVQLTNSHELAEVTPRHERDGVGQMLIDLDATEQDHPEVGLANTTGPLTNERTQSGNTQDLPMQAGRQKQAIPLIRRFNEHSERLLNSALGQEPLSKRQRMETEGVDDVSRRDSPINYISK